MSLRIEGAGLWWLCPSCKHSNHDDDMYPFDNPTECEACHKRWMGCPNETCYGDGEDCPICKGLSGGLVEVTQ